MRRSPENSNPLAASLNGSARQSELPAVLIAGSGRSPSGFSLTDAGKRETGDRELTFPVDRVIGGSSISEFTSSSVRGSAGPTASVSGSRQAEAVSVLETIHRLAEQAVARGHDRLSMTLRFDNGDRIRIRLVREGGELHTLLQTDAPGLEATLRQQWSQFSQEAGERGLKFQSMTFSDLTDSSGHGKHRDGSHEKASYADAESTFSAGPTTVGPTHSNPTPTGQSTSETTHESSRLRAWV